MRQPTTQHRPPTLQVWREHPHHLPANYRADEQMPRHHGTPRQRGRMTIVAEWLRACYLTRFSLLILLVQILIGPAGTQWLPSMLGGMFLLSTPIQMLWVTVTSLLVAAMARITWGITLLNAPRRFHDCLNISRECLRWSPWDWLPIAAVGLLPPLYCFFATRADWVNSGKADFPEAGFLVAIATGFIAVTLVLLLTTALQERLSGPEFESPGLLPFEWLPSMERLRNRSTPKFSYSVEEPLARWLSRLGPGYSRQVTDAYTGRPVVRLGPGHFQSIICCGVTFAAYIALGSMAASLRVDRAWYPPALCFALQAILLVGWAITGLAFFLDRFRVPVFLTLLGMSWLAFWGYGIDHYYEVTYDSPQGTFRAHATGNRPPRLEEVIHPGWKIVPGPDGKRTLVVVTASGGGIQASAWTAQVLCGLHERYGADFTRSLGLISGVSGGSVGTMFFVSHLQQGDDPLPAEEAASVRQASRRSSLDAAAWGLAYPDFVRNVAPPLTEWLFEKYTDRGQAIELAWHDFVPEHSQHVIPGTRAGLHDMVGPIKRQQMPVVVFNSVLVETGQRLLISPVCQEFGEPKQASDPQEFLDLYPGARLALATGARLSATFPFVSPICRPTPHRQMNEHLAYHVADGAYADNEGIVTAVDWVNQLCAFYERPEKELIRPFDRVLFVRIQPFPASAPKPAVQNKGWSFATFGPLVGMLSVRRASQAERGDLEANLLLAKRQLENASRSLRMQSEHAQQLAERFAPAAELRKLDQELDATDPQLFEPADTLRKMSTPNATSPTNQLAQPHGSGRRGSGRWRVSRKSGIGVDAVTITFPMPESEEEVIPLSWKLSEVDKRRVDVAWQRVLAERAVEGPIARLDQYFRVKQPQMAARPAK